MEAPRIKVGSSARGSRPSGRSLLPINNAIVTFLFLSFFYLVFPSPPTRTARSSSIPCVAAASTRTTPVDLLGSPSSHKNLPALLRPVVKKKQKIKNDLRTCYKTLRHLILRFIGSNLYADKKGYLPTKAARLKPNRIKTDTSIITSVVSDRLGSPRIFSRKTESGETHLRTNEISILATTETKKKCCILFLCKFSFR